MAMPAAALTVLLLQLCFSATAVAQVTGAAPGCPTICAGVSVPYPFGVREGCYLPGFNLTCDRALGRERLLIGGAGGTLEVAEISLANSMVRVMDTAGAVKLTGSGNGTGLARLASSGQWGGLGADAFAGPFVVSGTRNRLVVTGCNQQATLLGEGGNVIVGCSAFCPVTDTFLSTISPEEVAACAGVGCCETPIPIGRPSYSVQLAGLDLNQEMDLQLPIAVRIAETGWFEGNSAGLLNKSLQDSSSTTAISVVLEWAVESKRLLQPQDTATGCPQEAARSVCRSSRSTCLNVTNSYRTGYVCHCEEGYEGNPYLAGAGGCQDVDECAMPGKFMCSGVCTNTPGAYQCRCPPGSRGNPRIKDGCVKSSLGLGVGIGIGCGAGLLLLVLGVFFLSRTLNQQRAKVLKKKFFRQNRGHLLQQLVSQKADIAERMIIPLVELEKATNNFDKAREIGGGGHGTVYKGIMSDLHVVAIKKSKVVVQREIDEFINEVAILSQINHRHVVKLFGCCLETEVPLLVYEFISNGTLYHHLHVEEPEASLPWVERLRIATETARAFAYLHSAVSIPIVHRDIKSQNILLDGTLIAKVSDFGASRCIPIDETGDATAIQGTFGYLDPMYYYSGQLTEKSDVYSFGVLLMELLTRKKPCSYRSSEEKSLVAYFTALLATGDLASLLDPQVAQEGGKMVEEVALLAAACVRMEGGQRPTMRQVEMALENLRVPHENVVMSDMDAPSYAMIEGGRMEEVSRQYSQEEEYLLSSRYPR
ncbi:wall-associated receptor kinase 2 [Aegilops tauschii subsp. strangulata]|uniref:Protein kinase domain-containing protein n=1 Tax=Aegilops tauschii subsp. strangulata TaxID=200361 RepID=A0A453LMZ7_AEGTS|nr:wall-associated receptor kinase 2 [Aegilops tauschii subsp. strangulata]